MISGQLIVLRQLLILLLTAMGYGYWLWALTGRPSLRRGQLWVWLGLAGFCGHVLVLQSFVYLGLPLHITAWPALVLALIGVVLGLKRWKQWGDPRPAPEMKLVALVFLGGFLGQAPGLLVLGPERYFGGAHYDQANYVAIGEFLRSEPFGTQATDIGYRPWLVRALEAKEERITQCVALGALATVDGTDAQTAYGTLSLFFIALAGVATAAWLREAGSPRGAAAWAGLGAALTPALTLIHLDGFFSQNATLFLYPALAGLLAGRGDLDWPRKLCAAVLLAFFIGSYTEVAAFGIAVTVPLVLLTGRPWRRRFFDLAFILAGALALNPGYLGHLVTFLISQGRTTLANPSTLAELFPESGTWLGWGRLFADVPSNSVVIAAGVLVAALAAWGAATQSAARRWRWLITLGVVLLPLLALRALPYFSSYAFAKLTMHFTPIWIGAAMMGVVHLAGVSRRGRTLAWIVGAVGAVTVSAMAIPRHRGVIHPSGARETLLASEALLRIRKEAATNPQRTYVVSEGDPLIAQWLCYFGRGSNVVFDRLMIGDRAVPSDIYPFRRWAETLGEPWWLDATKEGLATGYEPAPTLTLKGALGTGYAGDLWHYYVAGDAIDFVFHRQAYRTDLRLVWLDLVVAPVTPNEPCELVLKDSANQIQRMVVQTPGWRRFQIAVPAGESVCHLELTSAHVTAAGSARAVLQCLSVEVTPDRLPNTAP